MSRYGWIPGCVVCQHRTRSEPTTKMREALPIRDQRNGIFERKIGDFSLSSQKRRHPATQKKEGPRKSETFSNHGSGGGRLGGREREFYRQQSRYPAFTLKIPFKGTIYHPRSAALSSRSKEVKKAQGQWFTSRYLNAPIKKGTPLPTTDPDC